MADSALVPNDTLLNLVLELDLEVREQYFGQPVSMRVKEKSASVCEWILKMSRPGPHRALLEEGAAAARNQDHQHLSPNALSDTGKKAMDMLRKVQTAFRVYKERFPAAIWLCCQSVCFASIVTDPDNIFIADEFIDIHNISKRLHNAVDNVTEYVQTRRRGVGGSHIAYVAASREQRNLESCSIVGTDRQKALRHFADFVVEVLPFLYAKADAPSGTRCPKRKLCTSAICSLLGISRSFLYGRKSVRDPSKARDDELSSVVDTAGVRRRQHRRNRLRTGYPMLEDLCAFECGCDEPCFSHVPCPVSKSNTMLSRNSQKN